MLRKRVEMFLEMVCLNPPPLPPPASPLLVGAPQSMEINRPKKRTRRNLHNSYVKYANAPVAEMRSHNNEPRRKTESENLPDARKDARENDRVLVQSGMN